MGSHAQFVAECFGMTAIEASLLTVAQFSRTSLKNSHSGKRLSGVLPAISFCRSELPLMETSGPDFTQYSFV